jgi:hypothetical protein
LIGHHARSPMITAAKCGRLIAASMSRRHGQ